MKKLGITQRVPLTRGEDGVWRITGSRVPLEMIVGQFKAGATAEQVQEDFPSVTLSEIYSVIAYYLQDSRSVEDYLCGQSREAERVRREVEGALETNALRERLRRRRAQAVA